MIKHVVYDNQEWGEPIAGERKSTNGKFTGQKKGVPLQDAKDTAGQNDNPYFVEENTINLGTLMDDTPSSMPTEHVGHAEG